MTESALKTDYDDTRTEAASSVGDQDDLILKKMGYKPTLHRGLGAVMNFAFGFVEVAVLASICLTYPVGLATGGPVVIFWGFVANFFFVMIIAHCMAEICGAYPSAGSVYHWAGQLASKDHAPIWSYITGWLNFLGNGAGDASFANGFASTFSAGIVASGGQALSNGQIVGVSIAILFLWSLLNCLRIDSVGGINYFAAFFQFGSIFVVFFALIFANQHGFSSRTYVFSFFEDKTYTPPVDTVYATFNITNSTNTTMTYEPTSQDTAAHFSKSYIIAAGLTTALFSFAGYEASAHMAEETHNCSENAPNGIINTCWATGIGGLFVLFGLLFAYDVSTVDDGLLAGTGSVIVDIFLYTCGSTWGQALAWIVTINYFLAGVSSVTVTGRITYALCRDGGFPFREWLEVVNPFTKSPIRAVMFVFLFDSVFLLLPLNPNAALAFYAIVGLSTFGFQVSCFLILDLSKNINQSF